VLGNARPSVTLRSRFALTSDERLIARLRAGDTRAFEAIYDRYERPIRSFCRHMLGQPEDADDAAQQIFLSAYRALAGSKNAIDLKPWLFAIARNRCRTMLRGRNRGLGILETAEREPSVEGLAVEVERREHLRDLLRDISRLPEDQRAALILTQLDTLRHDEVARVLAVPPDKVKALVFQARSSLLASQEARETPCREIREQLSMLTGAGLRRRTLRRHLRDCSGCQDFELGLGRQRRALLAVLPVASAPFLRHALMAHAASSSVSASAGGAFGGLVGKAVAIKAVTAVALVAGGAGAVVVVTHTRRADARDDARVSTVSHGRPAPTPDSAGPRGPAPALGATGAGPPPGAAPPPGAGPPPAGPPHPEAAPPPGVDPPPDGAPPPPPPPPGGGPPPGAGPPPGPPPPSGSAPPPPAPAGD
jgi:RNA polymerase sigma factor (sigma-70 family)